MNRHTSLVHFNTHVGFTQAHKCVLNLELGTDQSYMYMVEGMCMCVCVGAGNQLLQGAFLHKNVHLGGMMLRIMSGTELSTPLLPVAGLLHSPQIRLPPLQSQCPN